MTNPQSSLEELKRRLNQGKPVVVTSSGTVEEPSDPKNASQEPPNGKTVLKPQRWF